MSRLRTAAALLATALVTVGLATTGGPGFPGAAAPAAATTTHRVLFDNSKAETAGNADWIVSKVQPDPLGENAHPTTDKNWTGALSSWGIALQQTGQYSLKTLPPGGTFTFGTGAPLDLANFDTVVIPEPNIRFTPDEKAALMHFVQNGGGLFLISDHTMSDRNNDGIDSPAIINDLFTDNGVDNSDPFGFSVDLTKIHDENPRAVDDPADPVLHGPFGTVTGSIIRDGTTMTLHPADNPAVRGIVYRPGSSGDTGAFFVTSTFGNGRIAAWGDSSPPEDGTGQPNNALHDGWNDPAGTDAALALNATAWLSKA
ncbi:hydrolase [Kitasatospora sp. NPDC058115]|uniref:hydrolase n=1 Tax=Kitasatospora sp. NPDC058115 TaxID=3346347 RepID=UPI0036DC4BB0